MKRIVTVLAMTVLLVGCGADTAAAPVKATETQDPAQRQQIKYSSAWSEVVPLPDGREVECVLAYADAGGGIGVTCNWDRVRFRD